ncbi:MAG: glycosyl hydrolase family 65 protein [Candidatus Omnitrophota bacterium]
MDKGHPWKLIYKNFIPEEEGLREVLCALGNGYLGTRGVASEAAPTEMHYPGTYIAGVYNRLGTHISGRTIYNEDLVNCPNWTYLTFKIRDGIWFSPSATKILFYRQELDIRHGVFSRKILFQTRHGHKTWVQETRIVHMDNPHVCAIKYIITPENYSDYISVRSMLDGAVLNMNVERYRELNFHHWRAHVLGKFSHNGIFLGVKTSQSKIEVYEAAKLRVFVAGKEKEPLIDIIRHGKKVVGQEFRMFLKKRQSLQIEKTVSIFSSRDKAVKFPKTEAINLTKKLPRFENLLNSHRKAWNKIWKEFDIKIEGDIFSQLVIRLHIFHLLQTGSRHNINIDAGFPARGLNGEAYRGHIFWDEVFILPFFNLHMPEISKAILKYRYRRLGRAREYARNNGYHGAMFPWQSGSTGKEETQIVHLNPRSGRWGPDYSRKQRHVSFAIAYNIWNFWKITQDFEFMEKYGAETLLSIAQFASSLAEYDPQDRKFHIRGVVGPDEFHERFLGINQPGLIDNAYTNIMAVWTLQKAQEILALLPKKTRISLMKKIKLNAEELERWDLITRRMNIIFNEQGIISQFKGYFQLKELDWDKYKKKYKKINRLDRILKSEGKFPDNYKLAKQGDVLMIFYLLTQLEVQEILKRLGYNFNAGLIKKNYDYYVQRTSHGSTLSKVVHCFVSQLAGREKAFWTWFSEVLQSDIYDTQGGTTPEGIHAGVMGGSIDIVIRSFAGIQITDQGIFVTPRLPHKWHKIKMQLNYQKQCICFELQKTKIQVSLKNPSKNLKKFPIQINLKQYFVIPGKILTVSLDKNK